MKYTHDQLVNMLEDVVNELDLSDGMIEEHGPLGTQPATLVRIVLDRKDREIEQAEQERKRLITSNEHWHVRVSQLLTQVESLEAVSLRQHDRLIELGETNGWCDDR